ncbi:MAG: hypothetical protein R6U98_27125 [Pirellulaceae bacterium]
MKTNAQNSDCFNVRCALIDDRFTAISAQQADEHLRSHAACRRWACNALALISALSADRGTHEMDADESESLLQKYVKGHLHGEAARRIERALCCDLKLAAKWRAHVAQQLALTSLPTLTYILDRAGKPHVKELDIELNEFRSLYRSRPMAVAAAEARRSTFQTADGRLVVSVVDHSGRTATESHLVEIGIRTHEPEWVNQWAHYRVEDARGKMVTGGVVIVQERGNSIRVSLPPTEHGPYKVRVQIVEIDAAEAMQAMWPTED